MPSKIISCQVFYDRYFSIDNLKFDHHIVDMDNKKTDSPTIIMDTPIACGFPSPAADSRENSLDFNELLLKHKSSTYCLKASGRSLENAGIFDGDILIVDKSLSPKQNDLVVAEYQGGFTAKRFKIQGDHIYLHPENDEFDDIIISERDSLSIFGVITGVVRTYRK
jgi:DNA polymerase V